MKTRYVIKDGLAYFIKFADINSTSWTLDKNQATTFLNEKLTEGIFKELRKRSYTPILEAA